MPTMARAERATLIHVCSTGGHKTGTLVIILSKILAKIVGEVPSYVFNRITLAQVRGCE